VLYVLAKLAECLAKLAADFWKPYIFNGEIYMFLRKKNGRNHRPVFSGKKKATRPNTT
jgi:hypothetical protein